MSEGVIYYTNAPDVVYTKIGVEEAVLLHMGTQRCYSLNETGVAIWELFKEPHSVGEVEALLAEQYEADPDVLAGSVAQFVHALHSDNLIRVTAGNESPT